VIVIVIVFSDSRGGKCLFGSPKPLLVKVQFASSTDIPFEVKVMRVRLVYLERVLQLLIAEDAPDDVKFVLVIDSLEL
jgi:hypothetical protein